MMIAGVLVVAGAGASLYTTGSCACLSPAQAIVGWVEEHPERDKRLAKRYPRGMSLQDTRQELGPYARHCTEDKMSQKLSCLLPHESNFWRETKAEVVFVYGGSGLNSINVASTVRYLWE
jgi:hypothetical protein